MAEAINNANLKLYRKISSLLENFSEIGPIFSKVYNDGSVYGSVYVNQLFAKFHELFYVFKWIKRTGVNVMDAEEILSNCFYDESGRPYAVEWEQRKAETLLELLEKLRNLIVMLLHSRYQEFRDYSEPEFLKRLGIAKGSRRIRKLLADAKEKHLEEELNKRMDSVIQREKEYERVHKMYFSNRRNKFK